MAVTAAEIRAILSVQNQMSATLAKVQGELKNLGGAATSSGNAAKAAGPSWLSMSTAVAAGTVAANAFMAAARGVAGVLGSAGSASNDFGQSMANIRSLIPDADFNRFGAQIQKTALRLGKDYPLSAAEAGKSMELLAQKGISAQKIVEGGAEAVVKLSSATGADLVTATGIAAAAMDTFNVKSDDMGRVTNLMTGAMIRGGMSAADFGHAVQSGGAVIALAGGSIEDASIAIAAMAKAGIEGSDAGTSLKTMYMNLQPTTKAATAAMLDLGLVTKDGRNAFFDAQGNVKSYEEISLILSKSLKGLTQQQRLQALETMFGSDAIRAAAISADLGAGKFGNLGEEIRKVDAGEVAAKRLDSLKASLGQFGGSAETVAITLMGRLTPGLKTVVDTGTELLNTVLTKLDTTEAAAFFDGLGATATKAGDDLYAAGGAVSDFGTTVQTWLGGTAGAAVKLFADTAGSVLVGFAALLRGDAAGAAAAFGQAFTDGIVTPLSGTKQIIDDAGTALAPLAGFIGDVAAKATDMGAVVTFKYLVIDIQVAAASAWQDLGKVSEAMDRMAGAAGTSEGRVSAFALGIQIAATGLDLFVLNAGFLINTTLTVIRVLADAATGMIGFGKAVAGMATGDMELFRSGIRDVIGSTLDANKAVEEWMTKSGGTVRAGMADIKNLMGSGSAAAAAEHERGLQRAVAVTQDSMRMIEENTNIGMSGSVAAVEAQAPAAVAAVDAMGAGMVTSIAAAGPAMAAAASDGAGGAVAAVEAQQGPAAAAGEGLGANIGSGLVAGIVSKAAAVYAAVRKLVNTAIGAGDQEAEVESPSKRTTRSGQMWGQGYIEGLASMAPEMQAKVRDFIDASLAYVPTANSIARVEREIKDIRDKGQTDALFRAREMITIDSEALRLKQDLVTKERDLLPIRQGLASASRAIADAERGSLQFRQDSIQFGKLTAEQNIKVNNLEKEKVPLQAKQLELERQLLSAKPGSKEEKRLTEELDRLRKQQALIDNTISQIRLQSRLTEIDLNTQKERNTIAATGAKLEAEGLGDRVRGQEAVIQSIRDQLDVLGAERAVFDANEALIRNATENEIAYRERLIAVFKAEGAPLAARIEAGLLLVEQLHNEGTISDELYQSLKKVAEQHGASTTNTAALGAAAEKSASQVSALAGSLGKMPSIFKVEPIFKPDHRAFGGSAMANMPIIVGDGGRPEVFVPSSDGTVLSSMAQAEMLSGRSGGSRGGYGSGGGGTVVNVQPGAVVVQGSLVHERDLPTLTRDMFLKGLR